MKVVGYGICGGGEADRYMEATIKNLKDLCDEVIVLGNKLTDKERELLDKYDCLLVEDDREWGKTQNIIKQDFIKNHVAKLDPDITVCLDMDEVLVNVTRETLEAQFTKGHAFYVYIVNLWNDGWRKDWSFWNVRMWGWKLRDKMGDSFFKFEERPLHCGLAPKWCYALNLSAPFVLEHYGLKDKKDRDRKIKRYEQYDPRQVYREPKYYQALATNESEPYNRDDIIKIIETDVSKLKQPLDKEPPMPKQEDRYLIMREADGMTFDVPEKQVSVYLKQKYQGMGFKVLQKLGEPMYEADRLLVPPDTHIKGECIICGKQQCKSHEI